MVPGHHGRTSMQIGLSGSQSRNASHCVFDCPMRLRQGQAAGRSGCRNDETGLQTDQAGGSGAGEVSSLRTTRNWRSRRHRGDGTRDASQWGDIPAFGSCVGSCTRLQGQSRSYDSSMSRQAACRATHAAPPSRGFRMPGSFHGYGKTVAAVSP
jgi:hypothetical protein